MEERGPKETPNSKAPGPPANVRVNMETTADFLPSKATGKIQSGKAILFSLPLQDSRVVNFHDLGHTQVVRPAHALVTLQQTEPTAKPAHQLLIHGLWGQ